MVFINLGTYWTRTTAEVDDVSIFLRKAFRVSYFPEGEANGKSETCDAVLLHKIINHIILSPML